MTGTAATILQAAFVILILICMIMVLMGINALTHRDKTNDVKAADELRKEISSHSEVISRHSVFHQFLARDDERHIEPTGSRHTR